MLSSLFAFGLSAERCRGRRVGPLRLRRTWDPSCRAPRREPQAPRVRRHWRVRDPAIEPDDRRRRRGPFQRARSSLAAGVPQLDRTLEATVIDRRALRRLPPLHRCPAVREFARRMRASHWRSFDSRAAVSPVRSAVRLGRGCRRRGSASRARCTARPKGRRVAVGCWVAVGEQPRDLADVRAHLVADHDRAWFAVESANLVELPVEDGDHAGIDAAGRSETSSIRLEVVSAGQNRWAGRGSNPRPRDYEASVRRGTGRLPAAMLATVPRWVRARRCCTVVRTQTRTQAPWLGRAKPYSNHKWPVDRVVVWGELFVLWKPGHLVRRFSSRS